MQSPTERFAVQYRQAHFLTAIVTCEYSARGMATGDVLDGDVSRSLAALPHCDTVACQATAGASHDDKSSSTLDHAACLFECSQNRLGHLFR
jgi:hypothetical protein